MRGGEEARVFEHLQVHPWHSGNIASGTQLADLQQEANTLDPNCWPITYAGVGELLQLGAARGRAELGVGGVKAWLHAEGGQIDNLALDHTASRGVGVCKKRRWNDSRPEGSGTIVGQRCRAAAGAAAAAWKLLANAGNLALKSLALRLGCG